MTDNKLIATGGAGAKIAEEKPASKNRTQNPIQISWNDITITANPPTGRCKPKNALKEPKEIIRGVSGTVQPGQFLAIIGASGKCRLRILRLYFTHRCWQDHSFELPFWS